MSTSSGGWPNSSTWVWYNGSRTLSKVTSPTSAVWGVWEESNAPLAVRPSEHPARQEFVSVTATDGLNSEGKVWRIRRDDKGAVISLDPFPRRTVSVTGPSMNLLGGEA